MNARGNPAQPGNAGGTPAGGGPARGGSAHKSPASGGLPHGGPTRGGPAHAAASRGSYHGDGGQSNRENMPLGPRRVPAREVKVPQELQRETTGQERELLMGTWLEETGCEIVPISRHQTNIIQRFEIFGHGRLDEAVKQVESWIRFSASKTPSTTKWAKIGAHDQKEWTIEAAKREDEARKRKFKGPIPEEDEEEYTEMATLSWPTEMSEAGVNLKDAFGTGLEGIDPVRTGMEVYIRGVGANRLEIRAPNRQRLELAGRHVLNLFQKARSMHINAVAMPSVVLLDERNGREVQFDRVEGWWPNRNMHPIAPRLVHRGITSDPGEYWKDLRHKQRIVIQEDLMQALDSVKWTKGHYDLSARLGCLALREASFETSIAKVGTRQALGDFMNYIQVKRESDFQVKHWLLDDKDGEKIFARFKNAGHLLRPVKEFNHKLQENILKPTLRGSWVFQDPNFTRSTRLNYVVQVHWTLDEDALFGKTHTRFYTLDSGRISPKNYVDIKLLELGESKAWQFSLAAMNPITTSLVPTALRKFAEDLQVSPTYEAASREPFVKYKIPPSLKVLTSRLEKVYHFEIKMTNYTLELASRWYPGMTSDMNSPCWGLKVYHREWESYLSGLQGLRPGDCMNWGEDVAGRFLPDDGFHLDESTFMDAYHERHLPRNPNTNEKEAEPVSRDGIQILLNKLMEISQEVFKANAPETSDRPANSPQAPLRPDNSAQSPRRPTNSSQAPRGSANRPQAARNLTNPRAPHRPANSPPVVRPASPPHPARPANHPRKNYPAIRPEVPAPPKPAIPDLL